ncbi:hypothetical protein MRX96_004985 [Rhipicephalus microplus]
MEAATSGRFVDDIFAPERCRSPTVVGPRRVRVTYVNVEAEFPMLPKSGVAAKRSLVTTLRFATFRRPIAPRSSNLSVMMLSAVGLPGIHGYYDDRP